MEFRWRPRHGSNAIELMALSVSFDEPLTHRIIERIVGVVEPLVASAGPHYITPLQGARIVNNNLVPVATGAAISLQPSAGTVTATGFVEQVEINPLSMAYRSTQYSTWDAHLQRIRDWLEGPLAVAMDAAGVQNVRLEYQDRFAFHGDYDGNSLAELLRADSDLIAPHVFRVMGLWHSHTGRFRNAEQTELEQLHIGSVDEMVAPDVQVRRWTNVMVARENRQNDEVRLSDSPSGIMTDIDQMHSDIRELLPMVLTPAALSSIGINSNE